MNYVLGCCSMHHSQNKAQLLQAKYCTLLITWLFYISLLWEGEVEAAGSCSVTHMAIVHTVTWWYSYLNGAMFHHDCLENGTRKTEQDASFLLLHNFLHCWSKSCWSFNFICPSLLSSQSRSPPAVLLWHVWAMPALTWWCWWSCFAELLLLQALQNIHISQQSWANVHRCSTRSNNHTDYEELTLSLPSLKKYVLPTSKEKRTSEVVRIGELDNLNTSKLQRASSY